MATCASLERFRHSGSLDVIRAESISNPSERDSNKLNIPNNTNDAGHNLHIMHIISSFRKVASSFAVTSRKRKKQVKTL